MYSVILNSICKSYTNGSTPLVILNEASYSFEQGKFYSVIGRSGIGKTTLLSLIGTVEKADKGSIILCNKDLSNINSKDLVEIRRKKIGFVFQNFSLIEQYSVIDNLSIPLFFAGEAKHEERIRIIRDSIDMCEISENQLQKKVSSLSGGEKQRLAICRALINSPSIIIADEPTGNLDEENEKNIIKIFKNLKTNKKCTIIMVTHNKKIAAQADTILTLKKGKIVEVGESDAILL